jgi:hypothetical protein
MWNRFAVTAQYSNIPSFQVLAGNGRALLMLSGRAGGLSPIQSLISEAGGDPVERDTLDRRVIREGSEWQTGVPIAAVS